jgi:hypothetical protein
MQLQLSLQRYYNNQNTGKGKARRFLVIFFSPSKQILGQYLKSGDYLFLPHPFEVIIY